MHAQVPAWNWRSVYELFALAYDLELALSSLYAVHHARHPRKLNFINAVNPIYTQELGKLAFIYVVNSSYWCIAKG